MLPLTREERHTAVFLIVVILAGTGVGYVRKHCAVLEPVLCLARTYARININTADKETLKEIPGIGETLARRIIEYRAVNGPFADIADLRKVKGLNNSRFDRLQDAVCVE